MRHPLSYSVSLSFHAMYASLSVIVYTSQFKDIISMTFPVFFSTLYLTPYRIFSYFRNFAACPCVLIRCFHQCAHFFFGIVTVIVSKVCTSKVVGRYIVV